MIPGNRRSNSPPPFPGTTFENAFAGRYSDQGRTAKPIRLMVGLLLLKQLENLSDEGLVERWAQNPYYQFFCGMKDFQWDVPCDPPELVYFRTRIGEKGMNLILNVSARMHGDKARETDVVIDTDLAPENWRG